MRTTQRHVEPGNIGLAAHAEPARWPLGDIMRRMDSHAAVPDGKRCGTCGRPLEWLASGYNELGADESLREGIFKCPQGCETWTYVPRTQQWRKDTE